MSDVVASIKARLNIEDVVASYATLKKVGRSYKALCPFHSEKTPSFIVSPEKQIAYCFGCHKGGDIFKFIQEVEGVDFPEAVKILADKAGIKVDGKKFDKKQKGEKGIKDYLMEIHEETCSFFEEKLFDDSDESKEVLKYLEKRGISKDTIKEFRIGFASDSFDELQRFLIKKGFKHDVLVKSGLFSLKDASGGSMYDKFRGRLMFPIFDYMGRVIGFGGRALQADQEPKYLNSPETPIYSKGRVLYGLSHAKKAIKENDKVVVVEGYFDVISLYQAGICNVVASSGTAFTPDQVRLIKRFTKNVVSCFDTDSAGIMATKRAYEVMQNLDLNMKTLKMEGEFKDPADFMLENKKDGKEKFLKLINSADDFLEFYTNLLYKNIDVKTLEGRRKFLDEIIPLLKNLKSSVQTDYFVRIVAKYLEIKEEFLYDEIDNFKVLRDDFGVNEAVSDVRLGAKPDAISVIVGISLQYPEYFPLMKDNVSEEEDFSDELKDVYIEMKSQYTPTSTKEKGWNFDGEKMAHVSEKVAFLSLFAEESYCEFSKEAIALEMEKLIDKIKKDRMMHKRLRIEKALKEADLASDVDKKKLLLEEFQKLLTS
jgi:DNA primase